MNTERKTRGAPASTTIHTEGIDPIIVQLRTEQVRQKLSDYALGQLTGISPARLGKVWRGGGTSLPNVRRVLDALKRGNPRFMIKA